MEKIIILYLGVAIFFGISVNILVFTSDTKLTKKRFAKELFGAIWIAIIGYFVIKEFFHFSDIFVCCLCSLLSFLNSQIINFLGKDLLVALFKGILNKIKLLTDKSE